MRKNSLSELTTVKSYKDIFAKTAPKGKEETFEGINSDNEDIGELQFEEDRIEAISVNDLIPFLNHPFKLYSGKRLEDMVESIKENGIMIPLIVRKLEEGKFMVLAGHNRLNAGKIIGLENVPCIIKDEISDAEAKIIVTDSNFIQRSISEMLPSELAKSLKMQLEACKEAKQKQSLVNDVENDLKANDGRGLTESATVLHKLKSRDLVAINNNMNRETIRHYIRINNLTNDLLDQVDEGEISLRAAVDLSYLKINEQDLVFKHVITDNSKIDMVKAEQLRELSEANKLDEEKISAILLGEYNKKKKIEKPFEKNVLKISYKKLTPYFEKDTDVKTMEEQIIQALEFYRNSNLAN